MAVSAIVPLARPDAIAKTPRWLLDPMGPLAIRPAFAVGGASWLLRFLMNARTARLNAISADIATLTRTAMADTETFLAREGLSDLLRKQAIIELYETAEDLAAARPYHDIARRHGFRLDEVSGAEASTMEPAIAGDFAAAVVKRDWGFVADARRFVVELHHAFRNAGGCIESEEAVSFRRDGVLVTGIVTSSGKEFAADQAVIAAGVQSKALVRLLGTRLPCEGVMGYQVQLHDPAVEISHGVVFPKGAIGLTPYESGLAMSGGVEFTRPGAGPNWSRTDRMLRHARRVLPGLDTARPTRRVGMRPMMCDTRPAIGRLACASNVIVATGHGQLGVTLGATTAKHVAALAAGRAPAIDLAPFSPDRF
jgi:D-amino-acid dehydrogenase